MTVKPATDKPRWRKHHPMLGANVRTIPDG